jgi:hypothetical protein
MEDTQEIFGNLKRPVNGHEGARGLLAGRPPDERRKKSTGCEATRYLSAATQVDIAYAESVVSRVIREPFRALAPTFGVDVPVVAKWALRALRIRATRDCILAVIFAFALSVLAISYLVPRGLILLPLTLIAAWQTVSWEHWERIHNTVTQRMLRDRFDPAQAPSPPKAAERTRLEQVEARRDGNLVVFSGHSAFIGSGKTMRYQRLLLDVSRGIEAENGTPKEPDKFTSHDVHAAIIEAFSEKTGLARSLAHIRVCERLFVNGLHIQDNDELLPDPSRPPPTLVDTDLLVAATLHPTPEARTYVCVEMPGWHGQLVVTLFIRAVHTGDSLYIDWTFRVLPPIKEQFLTIDWLFELSRYRQLKQSMRFGLRQTFPALLRSPRQVLRIWRRPQVAWRYKSRQSRAIARGYVFDYGAHRSIREDACGTRRQHYFLARDETMYMLLAERTLTRAIEKFLMSHNVDLGQFNDQVKVIFDNSIKVGNIENSSGVTIGSGSSSTVNGPPQGAK